MSRKTNPDRIFFSLIALWFIIVAIAGFSNTVGSTAEDPDVPSRVILHGAIFGSWLLLFLLQVLLIGSKKVKLHMLLGQMSVLLAIAMGLSALYVSAHAAHDNGIRMFGQQVKIVIVFGTFMILGLLNRKKPAFHKRYMTFATISIMSPAVFRISFLGINQYPAVIFLVLFMPVIALIIYDLATTRKLNRATLIGTIITLGVGGLATALFQTQVWKDFAVELVSGVY